MVYDQRVNNLNDQTIRQVMKDHKGAICAGRFYPPIGEWDVSGVMDMSDLFSDWHTFNQPIGGWNVINVKKMHYMFRGAKAFNQPICDWNVSSVENMRYMFSDATAFDQPIGGWDTSAVEDMGFMFRGAVSFDQPLEFNTSKVCVMLGMFEDARAFNNGGEPLVFNTTKVKTMSRMFMNATSFMQVARFTDMEEVYDVQQMFDGCNPAASCATHRVNNSALGYATQVARFRFDIQRRA
jgi:hypothetical protein